MRVTCVFCSETWRLHKRLGVVCHLLFLAGRRFVPLLFKLLAVACFVVSDPQYLSIVAIFANLCKEFLGMQRLLSLQQTS